MQPSVTLQNLCARLVKIEHVICQRYNRDSIYLQMAETNYFIKYKQLNMTFFWIFTPAKVFIYQSMHSSDLAGFLRTPWNFRAFQTSIKLGFLVYNTSLCHLSFFLFFFIDISKWN